MTQQMIPLFENSVTLLDIENAIDSININKHNAIVLMTIDKALSAKVEQAKEYLLNRCDDCKVYESGGLKLQRVDGQRKTYSSQRINDLKVLIKTEESLIDAGETDGEIKITPYTSFKIHKK